MMMMMMMMTWGMKITKGGMRIKPAARRTVTRMMTRIIRARVGWVGVGAPRDHSRRGNRAPPPRETLWGVVRGGREEVGPQNEVADGDLVPP